MNLFFFLLGVLFYEEISIIINSLVVSKLNFVMVGFVKGFNLFLNFWLFCWKKYEFWKVIVLLLMFRVVGVVL